MEPSHQKLETRNPIRIAVVEDEPEQVVLICSLLKRYRQDSDNEFSVQTFSDGDEFLDSFAPGAFDVLLMDIQMRRIDGLTTAKKARSLDSRVVIIFITNIIQFAVQGYSVQALDFLVKPIDYATVAAKMNLAIDEVKKKRVVTVCIKTVSGMLVLDLNEIVCVELLARKLMIHTIAASYQCNETLQGIEELLADPRFFRCHAAFLVNLHHVKRVDKSTALVGDHQVPVSRHRYKGLLDSLTTYLGKGA